MLLDRILTLKAKAGHFGDTVRTSLGRFEGVKLESSFPPCCRFSMFTIYEQVCFTVYERSFTVKETTLCLALIDFARQAGGVTLTPP